MAERRCDNCSIRMPAYRPRFTEEDGSHVCEGCHNGRPGRPLTGVKVTTPQTAQAPFIRVQGRIIKTAHQSGDNVTIYHCPFCGSGQVVAGSDGTVECDFCDTTFIVQVQPQQSSMPQTINGVPQQLPGMPPPGADPGATEAEPKGEPAKEDKSFGGDDLSDKAIDPKDGPPDSVAKDKQDSENTGDKADAKEDDGVANLNKGAALYVTEGGTALNYEQYMSHLALMMTLSPEETLAEVRKQHGVS
jgi:ribosomal protein L37AE/L43A